MIKQEGKRVVDIVFYNTLSLSTQLVRIKKGITSDNEIVYDNPKESIYLTTPWDIEVIEDHYLNIGDGARYYIHIQDKPYLITDIKCDSPYVSINNNLVSYHKEGQYKLILKYKTYTIVRNVNILHIAVLLA